jgi:hypothetical protein
LQQPHPNAKPGVALEGYLYAKKYKQNAVRNLQHPDRF